MHSTFNPLSDEFLSDPYPHLARLREAAPVTYLQALDMWVVTRHQDVDFVFSHPEIFSAANAQAPLVPLCEAAGAILKQSFHILPVMSNADQPGHSRFRRRLAKAFSTRRMRMLEPIIEERCTAIIDRFADSGRADLVHELTYPLPALTIFTMIGFPDEDADRIKHWCADKLIVNWGRPTEEDQVGAARTMVAFWAYCLAFVERRRDEPADDLTSDLMSDVDNTEPLTDQEIASIVFGLSFAGHETTTNLATNCLRTVLDQDLWATLRADRELIPGVIEETLRYDSSVIAWRRIARKDTMIGSVAIPEGAKIMLSIGAANRDPRAFSKPDMFDPNREAAGDHLSFGKGIHFCLGSHLSRIEVGIILRLLLDRFATMELDHEAPLAFPPNIAFRGPLSLPTRWTLA